MTEGPARRFDREPVVTSGTWLTARWTGRHRTRGCQVQHHRAITLQLNERHLPARVIDRERLDHTPSSPAATLPASPEIRESHLQPRTDTYPSTSVWPASPGCGPSARVACGPSAASTSVNSAVTAWCVGRIARTDATSWGGTARHHRKQAVAGYGGVQRTLGVGRLERAAPRPPSYWPALAAPTAASAARVSGLGLVIGLLAVQHAVVELAVREVLPWRRRCTLADRALVRLPISTVWRGRAPRWSPRSSGRRSPARPRCRWRPARHSRRAAPPGTPRVRPGV